MNRRSLLAGTAAVGGVALSGCLSSTLNSVTSLASTPAGVDPALLDATGYELVGTDDVVSEEDVNVAGISDTIVVTSHLTEYEKVVGLDGFVEQPTALFAILSTPKISIAGRTFNPVAEMSSGALVELIADNYDSIDNLEHEADETVTILDQSVDKARFTADARFDGLPLELNIHVTEAAERGDDLLVAIGVYPRLLQAEEASNVRDLTEAVSDEPTAVDDAGDEQTDDADESTEDEDDDGDDADESTDDSEADDEDAGEETGDSETDESDDGDLLGLV